MGWWVGKFSLRYRPNEASCGLSVPLVVRCLAFPGSDELARTNQGLVLNHGTSDISPTFGYTMAGRIQLNRIEYTYVAHRILLNRIKYTFVAHRIWPISDWELA